MNVSVGDPPHLDSRLKAELQPAVTVYYDGHCPLCSREIAYYRTKIGETPVGFVDIAGGDFTPAEHGIDLDRARKVLHVKVGSEFRTGIDAAIAMWEVIPSYRWLARFSSLPCIYQVAKLGYRIFAGFRPYLQRHRRHQCESGTCAR